MITLVGTGHVLDIGKQVRSIIRARRPAVVALELDPPRFHALQHPEQRGSAPVVYMLLAFVQRRIAQDYGGQAGDEMLAAADEGKSNGAMVALIDKDARATFEDLRTEMPYEEKVKMVFSILGSFIFIFGKSVDEELERYQKDEASYLEEFGKHFPTVKRVLLDERNEHMAKALRDIQAKYPDVVAFVGDGHVPGMTKLLADLSPEVIRLKDLMGGTIPDSPNHPLAGGDSASVSYSVEIKNESN
jgi:pheromone shutdown protein TraB